MLMPSRRLTLPLLCLLCACGQEAAESPAPEQTSGAEVPAGLTRTPSTADARVFFITPADGETVSNPVRLEFGVAGMDVVPAGENRPQSGHHHVIIDSELPAFDLPIPADDRHVHFGDGSSETELTLAVGQHTLQLLFADFLHIPHDPPLFSEQITITVE